MKPLNQAERGKAFFNFIIFFIITIAVIVTLVFFSVQIPFKENERWRNEIAQVDNERIFLQAFNVKMEDAMRLLDSMSTTQNDPIADTRINNKLSEMATMVMNDSMSVKQLYNNVVTNLQGLQMAKQNLRNAYAKGDDANETQEKMADIQAELVKCQAAYNQQSQIIQQLQQH